MRRIERYQANDAKRRERREFSARKAMHHRRQENKRRLQERKPQLEDWSTTPIKLKKPRTTGAIKRKARRKAYIEALNFAGKA